MAPCAKAPDEIADDAQGRPGRGRDARAHPRGDPPGRDHADLDRIGRDVLERRGATSNFLGYHGFPAVICASPNDVIVHGIPGPYCVLEEGDIVSIDCGAIVERLARRRRVHRAGRRGRRRGASG